MLKHSLYGFLALVALFALACGGGQTQTSELSMENTRSTWITTQTDDGGVMVKWRDGRAPANFEADQYSRTDLSQAVKQASELRPNDNVIEGFDDVRVDVDDNGVVKLAGVATSEREAAEIINAALNVEGVRVVISYLQYPGHETDTISRQ